MKRAWFAAGWMIAASFFFATGARADEPPTVVDTTRVTYYLELEGLDAAKVEGLAKLLKREFPTAVVELIEGTLRIQTDGSTFAAIEKVLADERVAELAPEGVKRVEIRKEHGKEAQKEKRSAKDARPHGKVKVGDLCAGCADCLAAALTQKFPELKFAPGDGVVEVYADGEGQAAVEAWVTSLRAHPKDGKESGTPYGEAIVPLDGLAVVIVDQNGVARKLDAKQARLVLKGGGAKPPQPNLEELERRLAEARKAGDVSAVEERNLALTRARLAAEVARFKALASESSPELGPEALGVLRERLERVKARLAEPEGLDDEREVLEGVRQRLEEAKERLEGLGREVARGGGGGGGAGGAGGKGGRPVPPRPPERHDGKARRPEAHGPLAEFRMRLQHLTQALEHLNAAGYEGLAKQVAAAVEQVKAQAEETARRVRAEEEAREGAMRKEREARMAHERELARGRDEERRAAGIQGPATTAELRSEELVDLVRALHQQVNAMREELKALREQMGRDRPAPR